MCETRWVERHTNMIDFYKMYPAIIHTLEFIAAGGTSWDSTSKCDAQGLLSAITSPNFIVAFCTANQIMGHTKQLSILLQGE